MSLGEEPPPGSASGECKAELPTSSAPQGGLFENPTAASADVREYYKGWTSRLTDRSFELSMALIAANWAVFGSLNQLMQNAYARASVAVVIGGLLLGLVGSWCMGEMLREQINYAESNAARWADEWEKTKGRKNPWPYTKDIDRLGSLLRIVRTFIPIVGGVLFFVGLFL
jgi:hypothetical protein